MSIGSVFAAIAQKFIEEALAQGSPDPSEIQQAMTRGLSWARTLSKGYNDDTCLNAFSELQNKLDNL